MPEVSYLPAFLNLELAYMPDLVSQQQDERPARINLALLDSKSNIWLSPECRCAAHVSERKSQCLEVFMGYNEIRRTLKSSTRRADHAAREVCVVRLIAPVTMGIAEVHTCQILTLVRLAISRTHLVLPRPERPVVFLTLALDRLQTLCHTLRDGDLPLDFPGDVDGGHVCLHLPWVQRQYDRLNTLSFQFCSHVSQSLIFGRFRGRISCEAILPRIEL